MQEPLSIVAVPDGAACAFYGAAYGELLRLLTHFEGAMLHEQCRSRGAEACVWQCARGGGLRVIPARAELREALARCRRRRLAALRVPRPQSGRPPGDRPARGRAQHPASVRAPPGARATRWPWRTGSSCSRWRDFPGRIIPYSRWEELHEALGSLVKGRTVAMEISPDDAVPYLDRVPWGVVELIRRLGATVVPSGALVSRFAARWTRGGDRGPPDRGGDPRAGGAGRARPRGAGGGRRPDRVGAAGAGVAAVEAQGLVFDTPPIVAFGANSANPHYEPHPGSDATLRRDQVVLLDLWAGRRRTTVFADQTWMGFAGPRPPERVAEVWHVVRGARDAAVSAVLAAAASGRAIAGYEADRAARRVVEAAGYGDAFVHRTGHSIDRDLHGSGPHLDDYETHDDRQLVPGVGFSVEPGVYLPG